MISSTKDPSVGSALTLFIICGVAALGGLLFGFDTGVVSGLISSVRTQFALTPFWEGWFVSSVLVGCMIGAGLAGVAADAWGRKTVLLVSAVFFFLTAYGCGYATTYLQLILFRFIGGIGVGVASMAAPLYISEMSPPKIRGRFIALFQLAVVCGIFASYASNALIHHLPGKYPSLFAAESLAYVFVAESWRGMFLTGCVPALAFFLLLLFVPESPRWWAAKGNDAKGRKILEKLLGPTEAEREMNEIRTVLAGESGKFSELFGSRLRFGFLVGVLLMFFSQVTGINVIMYFGNQVFEEAGFSAGFSFWLQAIVGFANIAFTGLAIATIDSWGRKPLLKTGTCLIFVILTAMSVLFFLKSRFDAASLLLAVLPVLNVLFVAAFAMSWGPIPWVVVAEIFPTRIRGRAASVGTLTIWASCFLVVQTFPLLKNIAPEICFAIYAGFMIPALFFAWKFMPETKGKTLEEIETELYGIPSRVETDPLQSLPSGTTGPSS